MQEENEVIDETPKASEAKEMAKRALAKANEARKRIMEAKAAAATLAKGKEAEAKEEPKPMAPLVRKPRGRPTKPPVAPPAPVAPPKPKAAPKPAPVEEVSEESEPEHVPKKAVAKKAVAKKPKATPVYASSTEDSSDDDDFVLVRKRTVKKYRQMKGKRSEAPAAPAATHEISEKMLADKWAQDRYKLMMSSMFPHHDF
jgi:hypothetical protein